MSDSALRTPHILIVDDEKDIREMLAFCIKGLTECEISLAENGEEAIQILSKNSMDLVICDYHMPKKNGGDVYNYILNTQGHSRFVLSSSKKANTLKEFENQSSLFGELHKPNIIDGLKEILNKMKHDLNLEDASTPAHVPITLNLLIKLNYMPADIYLQLAPDKYIKIFNQNQQFEKSDFDKYSHKNINALFCLHSDMDLIISKIQEKILSLKADFEIEPINRQLQIHNLIISTFKEYGLKETFIPLVEKQVDEAFTMLQNEKSIYSFICKILDSKESYITIHSFILASVATILASKLDWPTDGACKKLVISSLMHDIFLDENIVNETQELLKKNQSESFKNHPLKASEFLKQFESIPPDTARIVLEQHGPGLSEISRLGSLFSFCHYIVDFIWEEHQFGKVDTRSIYKNLESISTTPDHQKLLKNLKDFKIFSQD